MDVINQESIATVDQSYWVEQLEALEALKKDPNFNKVIMDGYFKDYAVKGVSLLATDNVKRQGVRPDVMERLIAISALEDYFGVIEGMGNIVKQGIEEELAEQFEEEQEG